MPCLETALKEWADRWKRPEIDGESLAFLQYTSGSTGMPKGAMISHRNILCNETMVERALQNNEDTVCVTWLPMFHDLGLIGPILTNALSRGVQLSHATGRLFTKAKSLVKSGLNIRRYNQWRAKFCIRSVCAKNYPRTV